MIDIIINPTKKCNFCCDFCAASEIPNDEISIEDTIKILEKYQREYGIRTIIINGGDPLMMSTDYYREIIRWIKNVNSEIKPYLSLTSNLWDYYTHRDKWIDIFKEPCVGIMTSFQFGSKRKHMVDGVAKQFSVEEFSKIMESFTKDVGYTPSFISVLDNSNKNTARDTVLLAKEFNTTCKLNKIIISGRNKEYFPRYEYLEILYNIMKDQSLSGVELNVENIKNFFNKEPSCCPLGIDCSKGIICVNPDKSIYSCGYDADNRKETKNDYYSKFIKEECLICSNFLFCNSCRVYIREAKDNDDIENYCKGMKEVIKKFKNLISNKELYNQNE